ncbi:MAG TPA: hypothetical protein VL728_16750 [Cyclobacteriaceae bacterium]|nr:hypothetical protein [Cyclobacteriaceae bacterium]
MKTFKTTHIAFGIGLVIISTFVFSSFSNNKQNKATYRTTYRSIPRGCVFRTLMGEESSDSNFVYKTPERVAASIEKGLSWIVQAQHPSGGWGAGSHRRQDVMDPHAVDADPATTSMVAMSLLRTGTTLSTGLYSEQFNTAVNYLLEKVESSDRGSRNITDQTGTQIQIKLGQNIDVILTAQFLSNLMPYLDGKPSLKERVKNDLNVCVSKIQHAQTANGSIAGAGWAGVLQSSFATNALESAETQGADVDQKALDKARDFQKGNYDATTGNVKTDMGAGVMLYSVTGSARASAKEARKVEEEISEAKRAGKMAQNAPASAESLEQLGYSKDKALRYSTSYQVYNSAKVQAQRDDVMNGFGSNGGEEFLSYLQTGESMMIGKDSGWDKWYDNISGRMLKIQNDDGSWNGHHCITSPVFCTATSLLILSIANDAEKLIDQGK